ncbi:MAG: hypothetical protein U0929_20690 [Planctomycetaceae bacterium]
MMRQLMTQHRSTAAARGGFTLIEMLVATTLVVMMMLMFAQMYIAAIGSLGEQQAVARNDGKARLAETLIRADLRRMTFQSAPGSSQGILPLVGDEDPEDWQKGYFYLSENDQANPVDDVLQFTTRIAGNVRNPDQAAYFGRARIVPGLSVSAFPNHPDVDDGDDSNQVGASRAAEVSLFVRNGNLYRRVLLLRDVDLQAGGISTPAQPSNPATLTEFGATIAPNSMTSAPSFYKAFDYAAYCRINDRDDDTKDNTRFVGSDLLDNSSSPRQDSTTLPRGSGATESLGCSMFRFGFAIDPANQTADSTSNPDPVLRLIKQSRGQPVEYDSLGNFFGRPVHAETGSYLWGWPGTRDNPLLDPDLKYGFTKVDQLTFKVSNTPIVDSVTDPSSPNYTRATEDLLLSNVEAFDVEVWDQGQQEVDLNSDGNLDAQEDLNSNGVFDVAAGFVQLGHSGVVKNGVTTLTGYMRDAQRLNRFYGPGTDPNGVKPNNATLNWVFDTGHPDMWTEDPAYGPAQRPPYRPLMYRLNSAGPVNPVRGADEWSAGNSYTEGDVVFRPGDLTYSTAYRCVVSGSSDIEPVALPGQRTPDGMWEAFDNRVGLQKIRITVRLRDPIEGLPRQFSIVHTFANPK